MTLATVANFARESGPTWNRMIPVADAAERLDVHRDHLSRLCRESLADRGLAYFGTHPDGGQAQWWVSRDYDNRLIDEPVGEMWEGPDLAEFSEKQRKMAFARRDCVLQLRESWRRERGSSGAIIERLIGRLRVQFPDLKISRASLYNWSDLYARPTDLIMLIDTRGGTVRVEVHPDAIAYFKAIYLRDSRPSVRQCWEETNSAAIENDWAWPSLHAWRRQMKKYITREEEIANRKPTIFRQRLAPFIAQDPESFDAGTCYIGDHHQLNLWVQWGNILIRPWATVFMDWRTRKIVGWVLSENPNGSTILAALRMAILDPENFGGPDRLSIDNGKDFDAFFLHGATKKERRKRIKSSVDEPMAICVLRPLGIKAHFSLPFNPNGKSRLERWFGNLESFYRTFKTYSGNSPETKPERLAEILSEPHKSPTFEEVRLRMGNFIAGYNIDANHAMADLADAGKTLSPSEALARWCPRKKVMADPKSLDLLLAKWSKPTTVGRNGISICLNGTTLHFGAADPALSPFKAVLKQDRPAINISYDPHDLRSIRVYDAEMRFVTEAKMNRVGGGKIGQEDLAELQRQNSAYNRSLKNVSKHSLIGTLTREEQLSEVAAQRRDKAAEATAPPALRVIAAPVDGQAEEIKRHQHRRSGKPLPEDGEETVDFASLSKRLEITNQQRHRNDDDVSIDDAFAALQMGRSA